MQYAVRETADHAALNTQVRHITEKLEEVVLKEDWEAIKSARVLNAHSRANELRAQGHLHSHICGLLAWGENVNNRS